jgi:DNA topoisomerase-1
MSTSAGETHTSEAAARAAAKAARLRYVADAMPGIRRVGDPQSGFRYVGVDGEEVSDPATLERIRKLGIPPAYTDVWISPIAHGHLQATGRDVKGRKQYRYHERWRAVRDETKYDKMLSFGAALPLIRRRVDEDLSRRGLPREKVLAAIVRLLEKTRIRVGNEEYARQNESYGLTTMRDEHVEVSGSTVRFKFKGKSNKEHDIDLRDPRLAKVVRACRDVEGQELFQYVDPATGERHRIGSADVNAYLREITGEEFTAKDFRTWAGTVLCALCLSEDERPEKDSEVKRTVADAIKQVSERLGNTPTICRKCYVHPLVLDAYAEGGLSGGLRALREELPPVREESALTPDEAAVLSLLARRLVPELKKAA